MRLGQLRDQGRHMDGVHVLRVALQQRLLAAQAGRRSQSEQSAKCRYCRVTLVESI